MVSDTKDTDFAVKAVKQVLDRKTFPAGKIIFNEGQTGSIAYICCAATSPSMPDWALPISGS